MTLGNLVNYVKAQLGGFMTPQVVVSAPTGSTVTATLGDTVIGSTEAENDDGNPEWVWNSICNLLFLSSQVLQPLFLWLSSW